MHKRIASIGILLALILTLFMPQIRTANAGLTFHSKDTLIAMFKDLCNAHASQASYEIVGKTYEDRDIYIFKIGNPNGGRVLWDGSLHGWEDLGSEIEYLFANWLLTSNSPEVNRILERNYLLLVPIVNVDSTERQNRDFEDCPWGVDLNRNFQTGWSPNSPTDQLSYHGPSAASEPETQAMRFVFDKFRPEIYVNAHYGGGPYLQASGANTTLSTWIINRINQLSNEAGFSCPWPLTSGGAGEGLAVADAKSYGANSWLFEIASENAPIATGAPSGDCYMHRAHTLLDIQNYFFPKALPILRAMCESVEKIPPATNSPSVQIEIASSGRINYSN
jgi:hypothetical protein